MMTKEESQQLTEVAKNVVSLKEYFDKQLASNVENIESKLESIADAAVIRHQALAEATKVKADTLEKRFDNTNEWRSTVMDILTRTASKEEVNTKLEAIIKKVDEINEWKNRQEGKASQSSVTIAFVIAIAGLILSLAKLLGV